MKKPLAYKPPRIQQLLIRLQQYQLSVKCIPGKDLINANVLSRALHLPKQEIDFTEVIEVMVHSLVKNLPISPEQQIITRMIKDGWSIHKKHVLSIIKNYWDIRNELHEALGIIMKSQKIVIPYSMRQYILLQSHSLLVKDIW